MVSRFAKLFKKRDLDEQKAFQAKVVNVLAKLYPDKNFSANDDPLTIEWNAGTLGLTNLRSNFLFGPQTDSDLRELVAEHFRKAFAGTEFHDDENLAWEAVRLILMPQLMPRTFLEKMDLVHFPFGDEIVLGIVIDTEETYGYVLRNKLADWEVSEDELRQTVVENLRDRTQGIEMTVIPGDNAIFLIQTMDGFDAVRIVEPEMQSFIAGHIGSPYYCGVPNRDFLICGSKNGDLSFQDQIRSQISNDFEEQPYPLSRFPFEISGKGSISSSRFGRSRSSGCDCRN